MNVEPTATKWIQTQIQIYCKSWWYTNVLFPVWLVLLPSGGPQQNVACNDGLAVTKNFNEVKFNYLLCHVGISTEII